MRLRETLLFSVLLLGAACGLAALDAKPKPKTAHASTKIPMSAPAPASASDSAPAVDPEPTGPPGHFVEELDVSTFQRGNLHTHTRWSDGDSLPEVVIRWYRDHGYNFLALTDHNGFTDPKQFRPLERAGFVLIGAEEVTMMGNHRQVHENGLCIKATIGGGKFDTQREALAWGMAQIKAQGGTTLVNHPNFDWALSQSDVESAKGAELLEIWSGHPYVHMEGDDTRRPEEGIWDEALTKGIDFAGVAVDDAHHFKPSAREPAARAGRGWVEVFAPKADKKLICAALAQRRMYSSSGVKLKRITVKGDTFSVVTSGDTSVEFIGRRGKTLATVKPDEKGLAAYRLQGGETYVRARATLPDGKRAWTQAYRVGP